MNKIKILEKQQQILKHIKQNSKRREKISYYSFEKMYNENDKSSLDEIYDMIMPDEYNKVKTNKKY